MHLVYSSKYLHACNKVIVSFVVAAIANLICYCYIFLYLTLRFFTVNFKIRFKNAFS